jgi:hypothetical protein
MNFEEYGRKSLWPNLEAICRLLPEGARKP